MTRLAYPWLALGLALVPLLIYLRYRLRESQPAIVYSNLAPLASLRPSLWVKLAWLPFTLRMLALTLMLVALARPQSGARAEEVITEGVDILLAIDISSSMKTEDFRPKNRLHAAKEVVAEFIQSRPHDRLGMVVFAARAITKCPLTLDHDILLTLLDDVEIGSIEDGTAIGTALATSVNRLKDSEAKSRIIILLTDGVNNRGEIDPLTAAELAKTFGIKTYTVGAGKEGYAPYPFEDPLRGPCTRTCSSRSTRRHFRRSRTSREASTSGPRMRNLSSMCTARSTPWKRPRSSRSSTCSIRSSLPIF